MKIDVYFKMIRPLILITVALIGLNIALNKYALPEAYRSNDLWLNYAFLFSLALMGLFIIFQRYLINKDSVGKNFFAYVVIKMIASIVFLSSWLLNRDDSTRPMVYHFFCVFFPLLIVETLVLVRLLNGRYSDQMNPDQNDQK